ncbi:MAG: transporter substrate-binding domain-containing protein, partial [Burkholderiales bacterium]
MKELTPTGKLRVGVNLSNFLLVQRNADGTIRGIVPDLAQELARRLGVSAELRKYEKVGAVADGAKKGEWDVAFIGAEPQRAAEIDFTAPYVEIEACYLVPAGSPLKTIADVDRKGV